MLRSASSRQTPNNHSVGTATTSSPHASTSAAPATHSAFAAPEVHPNLGLHKAAASGNVGLVKYALDNGQPASSILEGVLPLHAACASGSIPSVRLLLAYGADVNAPRLKVTAGRSKGGGGSGHQSSGSGPTPSASSSTILALGAIPLVAGSSKDLPSSAPGTEGSTPLHFAAANGHAALIRLLLEAGARPLVMDKEGVTPQALAAGNHHNECVQLLRSWTDAYGPNGWAALAGTGSNGAVSIPSTPRELFDGNVASVSGNASGSKRRPSIENQLRQQRSFEQVTSVAAGVKASLGSKRNVAVSKATSNPNLRVNSQSGSGTSSVHPPLPAMPQRSPKFALFPHHHSSTSATPTAPVRSPSPAHSNSDASEFGFSLGATPSTAASGSGAGSSSATASSSSLANDKAGSSSNAAGGVTAQLKDRDREAKRRPSLPSILEKAAHPAQSLRAALGGAGGAASGSNTHDAPSHGANDASRESSTFTDRDRDRDRHHGKVGSSSLSIGSAGNGGHASSDTMEELSSELGHSYYYQAGGNTSSTGSGLPPSPVSLTHRISNKRSLSSILRKATGGGSSSTASTSTIPAIVAGGPASASSSNAHVPEVQMNETMSPQRTSRPLSPTAEDDDSDDDEPEAFSFIDGRPQQVMRRSSNSTRRTPSMRSMRSMRSDSNVGGIGRKQSGEMSSMMRRQSSDLTASALNSMSLGTDHRTHALRSASSASALSSQGGSGFTGAWATGAVPAPGTAGDKTMNSDAAVAARTARRARSTSSEALRDAARPAYPSAQTLANMDQAMASYRPRKSSSHSTYSATAFGSASPRLSGSKSASGHDADSVPGTSPTGMRGGNSLANQAIGATVYMTGRRRSLSSASATGSHRDPSRDFFKDAARIPLPSASPSLGLKRPSIDDPLQPLGGVRGLGAYHSPSNHKAALIDPEEGLHTARGSYADGMGPAPITAASSLVTVRRGSEGMLRSLSLSDAHDAHQSTPPELDSHYPYPLPSHTQEVVRPNLSTHTSYSSTTSSMQPSISARQSRDALVSPAGRTRNLSSTSLASAGASASPQISPMSVSGGTQLADDGRPVIGRTKRSTSGSVSVTSKPSTSSLRSSEVHSSYGHTSGSSNSHSHHSLNAGPSPRTQTLRLRDTSGSLAGLSAAEQAQAILRRGGGTDDTVQGSGRARSSRGDEDSGLDGEESSGPAGMSLAAQLAAYGDALARERKKAAATGGSSASRSTTSASSITSPPGSMGPPTVAASASQQSRINRSATNSVGRHRSRTDGSADEARALMAARSGTDRSSSGTGVDEQGASQPRETLRHSRPSDGSLRKLAHAAPSSSTNPQQPRNSSHTIGRASYDVPRSSSYTSSSPSTLRSTSGRTSSRLNSTVDSTQPVSEGRERSSSASASTSSYAGGVGGAEEWAPALPPKGDAVGGAKASGKKMPWDEDWTPSSALFSSPRGGTTDLAPLPLPLDLGLDLGTETERISTTPTGGHTTNGKKATNMVRSFFGGKKAPGSGTGPTGR